MNEYLFGHVLYLEHQLEAHKQATAEERNNYRNIGFNEFRRYEEWLGKTQNPNQRIAVETFVAAELALVLYIANERLRQDLDLNHHMELNFGVSTSHRGT
jgi:hypothetical protein